MRALFVSPLNINVNVYVHMYIRGQVFNSSLVEMPGDSQLCIHFSKSDPYLSYSILCEGGIYNALKYPGEYI